MREDRVHARAMIVRGYWIARFRGRWRL